MRNAKHLTRILRGLAAILLCALLLCACGRGEDTASTTAALLTEAASQTQTVISDASAAAEAQTQAPAVDGEQDPKSGQQENKSTQSGAGNSSTSAQTPAVQTPAQPAAPAADTVTLTVSFQTAVEYGLLNDPNFAGVLPSNGYFLQNAAVKFEAGESAFDLLKRTLRENNIVYSATSGGYVRSIGGLAERDCGTQSGWLYRVNGEFLNYSSKYYTLQEGDTVEFLYTCSPGDVGNVPF